MNLLLNCVNVSQFNYKKDGVSLSKPLNKFIKKNLEEFYRKFFNVNFRENNQSKLRTYFQYKKTYGMEGYLNFISNPVLRKAFSKLRLSDSKLPIEIGRYNGTKLPDRICTNCNLNEIGDEEHFWSNVIMHRL